MREGEFFQVTIPMGLRPKLERMARGSRRGMGNVVAVLIEAADESAPEWNIAPQAKEPAMERDAPAPAGG